MPLHPNSVQIEFNSARASMHAYGLPVPDAHDLANSLTDGQGLPTWEYHPSLRYRQPRRRLMGTNCHNHRVLQAVCYHSGRFKIANIPLFCEEGNSLTSATKKAKFYSRDLDPHVIFCQLKGGKWRKLHEEICSRLLPPVVFLRLWL